MNGIKSSISHRRQDILQDQFKCNTSSRNDGPKLGRKYLGNNYLQKLYQPIPTEYYKINMEI